MRTAWMAILVVLATILPATAGGTEPNGIDEWFRGGQWVVWPMANDQVVEGRFGLDFGGVEVYAAPRQDEALANEGDVGTDFRVYGIFSTIDANLAGHLLGTDVNLPEGDLYGGVFAGMEFQHAQLEAGYLVGGRVKLSDAAVEDRYVAHLCTEYQYAWQTWKDEKDRHDLMVGVRILFK